MHEPNTNDLDNLVAPDNYIILAIFSTLFCCFPLGILAIVYAVKVSNLWNSKKYEQARIASDKANKYAQLALILGGVFWVLYVCFKIGM